MGEGTWPGRHQGSRLLVRLAQNKAQSMAFKQRQSVMRSDVWMDQALSFAGADTI